MENKEFYRRNLPHFQIRGQTFFVTWLLADALLNKEISDLNLEYQQIKSGIGHKTYDKKKAMKEAGQNYFKQFEKKLHSSKVGNHYLKNPKVATTVANSIHYWDGKRTDLYCYCIMSNHIHAIFTVFERDETGKVLYLQDVMESIKKYSAGKCNKLLGRTGQFWQHESYDRLIRDREELYYTICYVLDNPVTAGLCKERKDWKWSYIKPEYNEFM
jgi:putative transposase